MRIKLFLINILFIILFLFKPTYSQELISPKLIGGMYYHIGYLQNLKHKSMGLGGKISYRLANNFRIGIEGYSSKANFKSDGSFYSLGMGGMLCEYMYCKNKIRYLIGFSLSGGNNKYLEVIEEKPNGYTKVVWKNDKLFITNPFISLEYPLSQKANLSAKIDYAISLNNMYYKGIRFHLGFLFNMKT